MNIFNKQPFLIAEISFNCSDLVSDDFSYLDVVKLLIKQAKESGVNGIDFHVGDSEVIHCSFKESNLKDNLGIEDYKQLAECCHENGLTVIVTPADSDVVDGLNDFVDAYKISASDLTNIPFIEYVASKNKPVLLSTAAATINEIGQAVKSIENQSNFKIALMHSVLSYPTSWEDANLFMIKDLSNNFKDYNIGYSDYTKSDNNMFILTTAYNYGAIILEKFFTLDKSVEGQEYAMDSDDVRIFRLNAGILSKVNGFKNKQPLICESSSRKNLRKSIVAKRDIQVGDVLKESDVEFKRPGTGISPAEIKNVLGKKANVNIDKGSLIEFDMIE